MGGSEGSHDLGTAAAGGALRLEPAALYVSPGASQAATMYCSSGVSQSVLDPLVRPDRPSDAATATRGVPTTEGAARASNAGVCRALVSMRGGCDLGSENMGRSIQRS